MSLWSIRSITRGSTRSAAQEGISGTAIANNLQNQQVPALTKLLPRCRLHSTEADEDGPELRKQLAESAEPQPLSPHLRYP